MFERVSILRYFKQHVQGVTKYFPYLLVVDGKKKNSGVSSTLLGSLRLGWAGGWWDWYIQKMGEWSGSMYR